VGAANSCFESKLHAAVFFGDAQVQQFVGGGGGN
jgi:hypothetical protein